MRSPGPRHRRAADRGDRLARPGRGDAERLRLSGAGGEEQRDHRRLNAGLATQSGEVQAENKSRQGAEKQANIKASTAANGVDVNSGSAVTTQEGAREEPQTDTATTMHNALLQAYGYRTQQTGFEAQSKLDTQQGQSASIGSYFGAAGSLVGNASSFGNPSSAASDRRLRNCFPAAGVSGFRRRRIDCGRLKSHQRQNTSGRSCRYPDRLDTWVARVANCIRNSDRAGTLHPSGYWNISIKIGATHYQGSSFCG